MHAQTVEFAMNWQCWLTLGVVLLMVVSLLKNFFTPEITLTSGLSVLLFSGVISPKDAFAGFSNEGVLTIAVLFVVARGVQKTGGLAGLVFSLMGETQSMIAALLRLIFPTVFISAFLNNTPVVAMFTPSVRKWAVRNDVSPSKLLIPLSYASILGGMCTLIGTSTNLVVSGMMVEQGYDAIGMFEISQIGVPVAVSGVVFLLLFGNKLLPDRKDVIQQMVGERREFLTELMVTEQCALIGKSIEAAGLRHLGGLYLARIERKDRIISPVSPREYIRAGDKLRFTGLVSTIVELTAIKGLSPVSEDEIQLPNEDSSGDLGLFEVVIATTSPLVGKNIREAGFRQRYGAAIIAVHRAGQRIVSKIGDIVLQPGDTLMIEAPEKFAKLYYNSVEFYLLSRVGDVTRVKHEKAPFVLVVLGLMVLLPALGIVSMLVSAIGAVLFFVLSKIITPLDAKQSIDMTVLVIIAMALGIGKAIEHTGLADLAATFFVDSLLPFGVLAVLGAIMILTNIFTELITNKAAVALFFPIAVSAAEQAGTSPRVFMLSVAVAAAASFATPLGYQTNLIIFGPGNYRFTDFLKIGVPMNVLCVVTGLGAFWLFGV